MVYSRVLICFVSFLVLSVESKPVQDDDPGFQLGCLNCHEIDEKKLNVHLVPHSHDDVGWLKTLDQYYYGLNSTIQRATVQYIITSVVDALSRNPNRTFVQVETAFFWKWWEDQSNDMKTKYRSLVENGQIEMIGGGWAMNDEACVNYQSTVDQFTWGLKLLNDTVGPCGAPRIGWQIDPFGHSREQASIFSQLGFDAFFFARIDESDKNQRRDNGAFDFAWQGSVNLANSIIYGDLLPNHYSAPNGFCWDIMCNDDVLVDDPESPDYNMDVKVQTFADIVLDYAKSYTTNNLLIPMGEDFQYSGAESNFINMDKLIKAFENHPNVSVFYSHPSCYVKAVNDGKPTLTLKTDDFFPYSDSDHTFWAGYFTSRPNSKRFERVAHKILQVSKQIYALASSSSGENKYEKNLRHLREAMGTLQHHDAITGTEKQHVVSDYVRRLHKAVEIAEESIGEAISEILGINLNNSTLQISSCLLANVSICSLSQDSNQLVALVYNPLAWHVSHYVRLPVNDGTFDITGPAGRTEYDLVPSLSEFNFVNLTGVKPSAFDLVFEAKSVPPLGFQLYFIERTEAESKKLTRNIEDDEDEIVTLGWGHINFSINTTSYLICGATVNNRSLNVQQSFHYYNSTDDSGAYIFRPNVTSSIPFKGQVKGLRAYDGILVKELHQRWSDPQFDVSQVIRVYKNGDHVEFDWIVGNITVDPKLVGKEVITKYSIPDFDNEGTFYTDSNGRELIQRKLNYRPDYTYNSTIEPIASNYYPVTSKILIRDQTQGLEVAVLNDRSQGGTSLNPGEIELMIHRRLLRDDGRGVGEPLNETEFNSGVYVRGSHYLFFGGVSKGDEVISTAGKERILAHQTLLAPWVGLVSSDVLFQSDRNISYSALLNPLPENVNVLTFEPWQDGAYLLRLENIFEKDDDEDFSTVTINLATLFNGLSVEKIRETTLGANKFLDDLDDRYVWQIDEFPIDTVDIVPDLSETEISLTPMQIRTFIIEVKIDNRVLVNLI